MTAVQTPELTLVKTATPATYDAVGDVISYSYVAEQQRECDAEGAVTVTDDKATVTCPSTPASLAPLASVTCTASYTITQADLEAGLVKNTATGHAFRGTTPVNSSPDDETVTAVQSRALTLVKTATPATYDAVGDVINYSYVVKNSGNVTLAGPVTVTDDKATVTCPAGSLAPGASMTCTASYTITQADLDAGSVSNIASAAAGTTVSPSDTETVTAVQSRALTPGEDGDAGDLRRGRRRDQLQLRGEEHRQRDAGGPGDGDRRQGDGDLPGAAAWRRWRR